MFIDLYPVMSYNLFLDDLRSPADVPGYMPHLEDFYKRQDWTIVKSYEEFVIGFLSPLHCDLGQISKSKAYYELGLKLLDPESKEYEDDKKMYKDLKEMIDGESWKETTEDN